MTDYETWCRRYGYDPAAPEAREDYERFRENLALLAALTNQGNGYRPA